MVGFRHASGVLAFLALLVCVISVQPVRAQGRLSDKDLEQRIKNMNDDVKKFRSMFNSAVGKTSIRKTTQAKDAKALVSNFQAQAKQLYDRFKQTKKADPDLQNCLDSSARIDQVLQSTQFDSATVAQWSTIKGQLKDIASAFQVPAD